MSFKPFVSAIFICFFMKASIAQTIDVTFLDANNKPIPNLVVSIEKNANTEAQTGLKLEVMDQVNYQFDPTVLIVEKGQYVDFPNSDDVRHHVYSFSSPKMFEIRLFSGKEAAPVQFTDSGLVVLGCNIHDSMVGYIYVKGNEHTAISSSTGKAKLDKDWFTQANPLTQELTLWHWALSATSAERISIVLADYTNNKDEASSYRVKLDFTISDTEVEQYDVGFKSKFGRP